ncbi:hypothetical protein Tco_0201359 [Tanacetum coccineum]
MVLEQLKTLKIQVGVQASRREDAEDIFSIGSALEDFISVVFVLVRNIIYSMVGEDEFYDDNPPPPPPVTPTQQAPHTLSTIKLPILKKGEYDIWAMKIGNIYSGAYRTIPIWELYTKGDMGPVQVSTDTNGQIRLSNPDLVAMMNLRRCRNTFSSNNLKAFLYPTQKDCNKGVSTEDANQKFLRSLPTSWSQVSLIMRTKPGVDTLSFDDLYNNLSVFESDVKGSSSSSKLQNEGSSSYTDELKYSFFDNQSSGPQLDHEDLEQVDEFDLEEMDLKWQVAMISMRLKKFYKNYRVIAKSFAECRSKGNQESRKRDVGNTGYKAKDNRKRPGKQEEPKALVTIDGDGVDWTGHAEDEQENFALMAYSNSGSNTEVEAQLVCHQQNQLVYEEKIRFMKIDLDDKTNVLTYHKKLLAEAEKEKEELKTKLKIFQSSSKGLSKLLNSQMSAKDKSGLGYGDQIHEGVLSYENEVLESVFDSRSSDVEDSPVYDRFAKVEGMHAVPPPMTGIYMPPKSDFGIDESNFTYGQNSLKLLYVNKTYSCLEPKSLVDAPIIEEYESDSDDEYVIKPSKEQEKPINAARQNLSSQAAATSTARKVNTARPIVN